MRIIGEVSHPNYKISIFKSGEKTIIQIENGQFAQTYKFNDGELVHDLNSAQNYLTETFLSNIDNFFELMKTSKNQNNTQLLGLQKIEFPIII